MTTKHPTQRQYDNLFKAAKAYADLAERHLQYEQEKTAKMQEAANLARQGKQQEANSLLREAERMRSVFDYTDVHKALIKAAKPLRRFYP